QAAGVTLDVQQVAESPFLRDATRPAATNANADLFIVGRSPDPDPDSILSAFTCGQINISQDANYCDPDYDGLYAKSQTTTAPSKRRQAVDQAQQKLYTDSPYSVLWYPDTIEAYRNDLFAGFVQLPRSGGSLWGDWAFGPYGSRLKVHAVGAVS